MYIKIFAPCRPLWLTCLDWKGKVDACSPWVGFCSPWGALLTNGGLLLTGWPKIIIWWSPDDPKKIPKWPPDDTNTITRWYQNDLHIIRNPSLDDVGVGNFVVAVVPDALRQNEKKTIKAQTSIAKMILPLRRDLTFVKDALDTAINQASSATEFTWDNELCAGFI